MTINYVLLLDVQVIKHNFQFVVAKSRIALGFECLTWISNLVWNHKDRALLVDFLHIFICCNEFYAQKSANPATWYLESWNLDSELDF